MRTAMPLALPLLMSITLTTACTDDRAPTHPTLTTPSASTSTTPAAPPPTKPAQADDNTPAGSIAFADHFAAVLTFAMQSGSTKELSALSGPGCTSCASYIDKVREIYGAGGTFTGGAWTLTGHQVELAGSQVRVHAAVTVAASSYRESTSSTHEQAAESHDSLVFVLERVSDGWKVSEIERKDR